MKKLHKKNILTSFTGMLVLVFTLNCYAAEPQKTSDNIHRYDDKDITIIVGSRTPDQLSAFYTGRGFNQKSIEVLSKKCFVFARIENKTYDTLWLILDDWKFYAADGSKMKRWKRSDWLPVWKETGLTQAHQSTFGWTQLPESRDLRQHEHVGGNIVVEWKDEPFKLIATLKTRPDKSGDPRIITVENLTCKAK